MNIPETGAVFAFGKSLLAVNGDNTEDENYFFIKNDPITKVVCGSNQSAVICESGRCFVWGENQSGQLGIGTCENAITKPSCVKEIKKLGQKVKDIQFGGNFSILLTDCNKIFYSGKNIFPFNAKIESLESRFKSNNEVTTIPVHLPEFCKSESDFEAIRAGDEHFVAIVKDKTRLFGWGSNSNCQLATIDSYLILKQPAVFFETEKKELIKFVECGKLSTVIVTELNDLYVTGRFGGTSIASFTKIKEPILNSTITCLHISEQDEIYLVSDAGLVFRSSAFSKPSEIFFEQLHFLKNKEKIISLTSGNNFLALLTERGRCFSSLTDDKKSFLESNKLRDMDVLSCSSGHQHILVSVVPRNKDDSNEKDENNEMNLNKTYTINFQPINEPGNGVDNYQEPDTGERTGFFRRSCEDCMFDIQNLPESELDEAFFPNRPSIGSRATTIEYKDTDSDDNNRKMSKMSSAQTAFTDNFEDDDKIRFIDNGVNIENGNKKLCRCKSNCRKKREQEFNEEILILEENKLPKAVSRRKTPMPRDKSLKNEDDMDEEGIIDRDEDEEYNDDDDVSTNTTMNDSDYSLEDYLKEEAKIKAEKAMMKYNNKWNRFVRGISCKNTDTVVPEVPNPPEIVNTDKVEPELKAMEQKDTSSCNIM